MSYNENQLQFDTQARFCLTAPFAEHRINIFLLSPS